MKTLRGSEQQDLVVAALVAAQAEMPAIPFDSKNPFHKSRYAGLGSVISHTRPILAKHGLCILQTPKSDSGTVRIRTLIVHASGQWLDGGTMALPITEEKGKSRSQVVGSIVTYLRRYAWSSVLGLYADEDTDGGQPHAPAREQANGTQPQTDEYGEIPEQPPQKPKPPRGPELLERLYARDKEMTTAGQIQSGELVSYMRNEGLQAGWPDDIAMWDEGQTRISIDTVKDFIARRTQGRISWRQEEALRQELDRKGLDAVIICSAYEIDKLSELKASSYDDAMRRLREMQPRT